MCLVNWLREYIPIIAFSALFLTFTAIAAMPAIETYRINNSPEFDYRAVESVLQIEDGDVVSVAGRVIYVSLNQSNMMIVRYRLRHPNDRLRITLDEKIDVSFINSSDCTVLANSTGRDEIVLGVFLVDYCDLTVSLRVGAMLFEEILIGRYQVTDMFRIVVVNDTIQFGNGYDRPVAELTPMSVEYDYMSLLKDRLVVPIAMFITYIAIALIATLIDSRNR